MSFVIAAKGDLQLLPQFEPYDFAAYELYLGAIEQTVEQQLRLLPSHLTITAAHTPGRVKIKNHLYPMNLCAHGEIGDASLESLTALIEVCKRRGIKTIAVHAAMYDVATQSKEEALQSLAQRVRPLLGRGVNLCFETDALWFTRFNVQRSLLTGEDDFQKLDALLQGSLRITADIEHLSFTFYLSQFIKNIGGESVFLEKYPEPDRLSFQRDIQQFILAKYSFLQRQFYHFVAAFFQRFRSKIEHIHINGTDCQNYIFNPQTTTGLPLLGEHLPLGFNHGTIQDRLDYSFLTQQFSVLPPDKQILIVMEVWRATPGEQLQAIRYSKLLLEKQLGGKI